MGHAIAKGDDPVKCVFVLIDDELLQLASPRRVQSADNVNQTLRI